MTVAVDLRKILYGQLFDYFEEVESAPLLKMTLVEATNISNLLRFLKDFIPEAFFTFVICFKFGKPLPIPTAPIAHWESIPQDWSGIDIMTGDYQIGWQMIFPRVLKSAPYATPKVLLDKIVKDLKISSKLIRKSVRLKKRKREEVKDLCCIILAPEWEKTKEVFVRSQRKKSKPQPMPMKKFIAEFRLHGKEQGVEVLTFQGFLCKYQDLILKQDFKEKWLDYQQKLYLDFLKRFPQLAYSLCYDDYLSFRDIKNRAEIDLLDRKYSEAIAMYCKALETVLRIYYFMTHMKDAPEEELGWLVQSMKKHIVSEMGDIYYKDLEFVLVHRPYAVHAKREKKEPVELDAIEVSDRINIFCKTFFYLKWKIRI